MLQMRKIAHLTQNELKLQASFPPAWKTMAELENITDKWLRQWLINRKEVAKRRGLFAKCIDYLDRIIRTDLPEHTDNPEVSSARKLRIVRSLHRTNILIGAYRRYINILTPLIKEIAFRQNRKVRLLELASGSGEMAMNLARLALKNNLPVEATGSDYIDSVVKDAEKRAIERGLKMQFRTINALDMSDIKQGAYDILLLIGTMHHFTPGQLAKILVQSKKSGCTLFVGIDGYRSVLILMGLPFVHLFTFLPDHIHDAWLTARKFYTSFELKCISQVAVPDAKINVEHSIPGISVLNVRFR